MTTLSAKISISFGSAVLFTLINLPQTYKLTNKILPFDLYNLSTNCPTHLGLLVHATVFFVLTYLSMGNSYINPGVKLKHTLYGTLIFFLLSSPAMFSLVGSVLGTQYASVSGCPTLIGVAFNAFLYCFFLIAVMYLP
jgi:hypothetical protein